MIRSLIYIQILVLVIRVYHLTLFVYFWDRCPCFFYLVLRLFVIIYLFQYSCLIIATAHGKHKSNWTPTAWPARFIKWRLKSLFPSSSCFLSTGLIFPNFKFLIFSTSSYKITHNSHICAPCDISYPVFVSCLILFSLKFTHHAKFICRWVFLPYFNFVVHSAGHKSFRNESVRFFSHLYLVLIIVVFG